jgi:hypothetical protein
MEKHRLFGHLGLLFWRPSSQSLHITRHSPNVELLTAAPMGCKTSGPSPNSFISAFIEIVESVLARQNYVDVSESYHELCSRGNNLIQSPVHFPHGTQATIRLQPHSPNLVTKGSQLSETVLVLEMIIRSPLQYHLLDRVMRWLIKYVPPEIAGLRVTELVRRTPASQDSALPTQAIPEAQSPWSRSVLSIEVLYHDPKLEVALIWTV